MRTRDRVEIHNIRCVLINDRKPVVGHWRNQWNLRIGTDSVVSFRSDLRGGDVPNLHGSIVKQVNHTITRHHGNSATGTDSRRAHELSIPIFIYRTVATSGSYHTD